MDNDNKIRLFMGRDIIFYSEKIKQPTIGEIIDLGWSKFFNEICLPYMINFEYVGIDENYIKDNKIKIFDLFWLPNKIGEKTLLQILIESLVFIFKTENISVDTKEMSITINDLVINRDNFEELASYCRDIFKVQPYKKEEKEEVKVPEHLRQRYEKYKIHQQNNKKDSSLEILKSMNYIVHYQYSLDYKSMLNLTIFQFFNTQDSYVGKEYYENNLQSVFAGADAKKIDLTHWMNKLKIDRW